MSIEQVQEFFAICDECDATEDSTMGGEFAQSQSDALSQALRNGWTGTQGELRCPVCSTEPG